MLIMSVAIICSSDRMMQANCWFMVSLIQECLGEVFHGSLTGRLIYTTIGNNIREDIRAAARLMFSFPFEEAVGASNQRDIFLFC